MAPDLQPYNVGIEGKHTVVFQGRPFNNKVIVFALLTAVAASAAGCFPGTSQRKRVTSLSQNDPGFDPDPGNPNSPLQISSVYRNAANPATMLDILGDGSGAMGSYCRKLNETSTDGATTCNCVFSFHKPVINDDGVEETVFEQVEVPTSYSEMNLVRCKYGAVPADLKTSFRVKLKVSDQNLKSNQVEARFSAGEGDPTDWTAFAEVKRYQCREILNISHQFNPGKMYDPILSDDLSLSFPMNFYTTNMGASLALYADMGISGWNCPALPNDSRENYGLNLKVFSRAPEASGNYVIYPKPASSLLDRTRFHLARRQTGAFRVPVNALLAPGIPSISDVSSATPPLGFGAKPLTDDAESCPGVAIPTGYKWVKVWLFRATMTTQFHRTTSLPIELNSIGCNPGAFNNSGTFSPVFSDCDDPSFFLSGQRVVGGRTHAMNTLGLADRILGTNMCVKLESPTGCNPGSGAGCTTNAGGTSQKSGFEDLGLGTDIWQAIQKTQRCGVSSDPAGVCNAGGAPLDRDLGSAAVEKKTNYDFMLIATPVDVKTSDFRLNTEKARLHTPVRFNQSKDCPGDNPNDCNLDEAVTYGPIFHDINEPGDPSAGDQNRVAIFPICAIQPKTGGAE